MEIRSSLRGLTRLSHFVTFVCRLGLVNGLHDKEALVINASEMMSRRQPVQYGSGDDPGAAQREMSIVESILNDSSASLPNRMTNFR